MAAAAEPLKQRYQGVQKESAGYRLMTAMGWKEGEGLGAEKQGIKEHIRVKKNLENWGVGAVTAADHAKNWSVGMADFHRVLSTLSEVTSQHAGKRKGSDGGTTTDEESDASDGELRDGGKKREKKRARREEAAAKERTGKMKKRKKAKAKAKASSSDEEEKAEEEEKKGVKEEAPLPAKRVKLATHVGRFHKRENAKKVGNYSQLDLAAILGEDPFAATAAAVQSVQNTAAYLVSSSGSESDRETPSRQQAQQAQAGGAAEEVAVVEELWWSSYFVKRGKMGSLRKSAAGRKEFSEKDQVNLYTSAHGGATKGRVGLGRSSMPKKVGGVRWSGKKVTFGGDDDGSDGEEGGGEEGSEEVAPLGAVEAAELAGDDAHGVEIIMPPNNRGAAAAAAAGEKKVKWKKVTAEVLKEQQPGGMKLKALAKAVAERLGAERGKEAKAEVEAAVKKSSQFVVDGKMVRLVV